VKDGRTAAAIRAALNVLALFTAAVGGTYLHDHLPHGLHAPIFYSTTAIGTAIAGFAWQAFGKLDKLLQDTEKYDIARTTRAYSYVRRLRKRLVLWFWVVVGAAVTDAAIAATLPIRPRLYEPDTLVIILGYVLLCAIVLGGVRIVTGYLSLDGFRLELLKVMAGEQKRIDALRAMRGDSLPDVSKAPPMKVLPARKSAPGSK
jgi:hypothetical protein